MRKIVTGSAAQCSLKGFIFLFCCIFPAPARQLDRTPPTVRIVAPRPGTVITTNQLKIAIDAYDSASGIEEVRLWIFHSEPVDTNELTGRKKLVRIFKGPPYKITFDCSAFPDYHWLGLRFDAQAVDSSGNIAIDISNGIVLDRNPRFSSKVLQARRRSRPTSLPGSEKAFQWPKLFTNAFNAVHGLAEWDEESLYVYMFVRDTTLWYREPVHPHPWNNDCIELFFDPDHDRNPMWQSDDMQVIIALDGKPVRVRAHLDGLMKRTFSHDSIGCSRILAGSLNRTGDADTGYLVSVALPWKVLGHDPRPGDTIGFDIFNTDIQSEDDERIGISWAGNERTNNNNPSEWGNLVLVADRGVFGTTVAVVSVFVIIGSIYLACLITRPGKTVSLPSMPKALAPQCDTHNALAREIRAHIEKHYEQDSLSIQAVAREQGVSREHVSRLLAREYNMGFSELVNRIRIDKARELLADSRLSISQVAFEVGYGSVRNFGIVFVKLLGVTPSEYRKRLNEAARHRAESRATPDEQQT